MAPRAGAGSRETCSRVRPAVLQIRNVDSRTCRSQAIGGMEGGCSCGEPQAGDGSSARVLRTHSTCGELTRLERSTTSGVGRSCASEIAQQAHGTASSASSASSADSASVLPGCCIAIAHGTLSTTASGPADEPPARGCACPACFKTIDEAGRAIAAAQTARTDAAVLPRNSVAASRSERRRYAGFVLTADNLGGPAFPPP
jgi:hypothetical protein